MTHTSARGIAQLGFHIAEEEDAAVDVPQLSFSGYILHRTQGFQWGLRGSQSRVWQIAKLYDRTCQGFGDCTIIHI